MFGFALMLLQGLGSVFGTTAYAVEAPESEPAPEAFVTLERSMGKVNDFESLRSLTSKIADQPFAGRPSAPPALGSLTYEQYREIAFRPKQALWWDSGLPFWIETFHQGFVQDSRVMLYVLNDGGAEAVPFATSNFKYEDKAVAASVPANAGHAGIKICGRFPGRSDGQELLTFLGSSYFRSHTANTIYGASARGIAVDIGINDDEEFPFFRSFWICRPEPGDETLTMFALLDSPSVSGAYRFVFRPGTTESTLDVKAELFFRDAPQKVGIAPLTSMWIWGDGLKGPAKDKRPGVHDSDGLLIRTGEQSWTWHAFARQQYPSVSTFPVDQVHGFGLLQRNRAFFHYDDHNARYDLRPSVYVTPSEPWSKGRVELLELPGAHEGIDNLAAYYVAEQRPEKGEPLQLEYRVAFLAGDIASHSKLARATNLNVDRNDRTIDIEVRFSGPAIANIKSANDISLKSSTVRGEVVGKSVHRTETGDWLAAVRLVPSEDAPIELKMTLTGRSTKDELSETLSYLCPPEQPDFVYPDVYTRIESDPAERTEPKDASELPGGDNL